MKLKLHLEVNERIQFAPYTDRGVALDLVKNHVFETPFYPLYLKPYLFQCLTRNDRSFILELINCYKSYRVKVARVCSAWQDPIGEYSELSKAAKSGSLLTKAPHQVVVRFNEINIRSQCKLKLRNGLISFALMHNHLDSFNHTFDQILISRQNCVVCRAFSILKLHYLTKRLAILADEINLN